MPLPESNPLRTIGCSASPSGWHEHRLNGPFMALAVTKLASINGSDRCEEAEPAVETQRQRCQSALAGWTEAA